MANQIVWESAHEFYFNSKEPITAVSLADNLLGLDGIAQYGAKVLEKFLDIQIQDSDVLIERISLESYKDSFWFRLIFGRGEKGERKFEKFREALKIRDMDGKTLAQFALAGAVLYGAYKLSGTLLDIKNADANKDAIVHFENSFNNMAIKVGLTGEEAKALFEEAIKSQEGLKKDVMKLTRPAGQKLEGTITFDQDETFSIPSEVVDVIPPKYVKPEIAEPEERMQIDVVVRALDLDRPETGWWAIIPELSEKRLSVVIDDDVNPATLPAGKLFKADLTVTYNIDKHGNKTPKKIHLYKKL